MEKIVQIIPAPLGLIAVFTQGEKEIRDPVDVIGLSDDGSAYPLVLMDGYYDIALQIPGFDRFER